MRPARLADGDAYRRRLNALLLPAAFFNGYDGQLRALLLPELQRSFHVGLATIGAASVPIGAGQFVAFLVVRMADRVGRRPVLLVSLLFYALFTGLTALATSVWAFAAFQGLAQVAIGTEFALAVIVLAEETPGTERGRALGRLLVAGPLGAIFTAGLLGAGLGRTALGWRAFYLVGLAPILLLALARRGLRETSSFTALAGRPGRPGLSDALARPWRSRIVALGAVSFLDKVPVTAGAGWWVYYAERERHLSTGLVSLDLGVAYAVGTLGYAACGHLIDRLGRKPVAAAYLVLGSGFGLALFQARTEPANFAFLLLAVFFGLGVGPALSALSAESFPTAVRAQASAIVGNGFANAGELLGPALVGVLGASDGAIGSVGGAVSVLMVLALASVAVLWRFVAETRGAELDADDPLAGLCAPGSPQGASTLGAALAEGE